VRTRLLVALLLAISAAIPHAQQRTPGDPARVGSAKPSEKASDLDQLMARVLSNRDENWRKLQQYILDETQTMAFTGPGEVRLWGGQREYRWFPREGFFIQSPTRVDGVTIGEEERKKAEDRFLRREQAREKRRAEIRKEQGIDTEAGEPSADTVGDVLRQTVEPEFVSSAYFLRFKFDEGQYALVGREKLLNRDVLRIEYYPTRLFADDPDDRRLTNAEREKRDAARKERLAKETDSQREARERGQARDRERERQIERQMNKVAKATLWVDPLLNQILQYQLHNMDMDFLPGRSLLRVDEMNAGMRMSEPFPGVWLPSSLEVRAGFMTALGRVAGRYDVKYTDYRLAETGARIIK
jgi:hypothetical protein